MANMQLVYGWYTASIRLVYGWIRLIYGYYTADLQLMYGKYTAGIYGKYIVVHRYAMSIWLVYGW